MSHIILPLAYMYVQERRKKSVNSTRWDCGMKPVDGTVKECLGVVKEWLVCSEQFLRGNDSCSPFGNQWLEWREIEGLG